MRFASLLALALSLVACRGGGGGGDDMNVIDAPGGNGDNTIQEVQNDSMAAGTKITLKGVVVTAIDRFGGKKGDFWVEEPEGGPFSGVQIYGGPIDQVAALTVGDIVDITGAQKAEFALSSDTSGNTLTEVEPVDGGMMTVTKVSSGTPLAPVMVDALTIGQMPDYMARAAEWEKWEGVLIQLTNVQAFSGTSCIKSAGQCSDPTYERFDVTGDVQVQSALSAMPSTKVVYGDCLSSLTGVVTYFFNYEILPRETTEIATGGTSCPHENTTTVCADTIDNDGNGFSDCMDNGCVVASAACRMDDNATITKVQDGTDLNMNIRLPDVYVTAVSKFKQDVWVSTSATAASGQGVQVHFNSKVSTAVVPGKKVTVIGKVIEFNDNPPMGTGTLTEISGYDILVDAAAAVTVTPVTVAAVAPLTVDSTAEAYEGVLVKLQNVSLSKLADSMYHVGQLSQTTTTFDFDDDIYQIAEGASGVPKDTCFASITGIWSYQVYDNAWYFLPSGAGTTGGTCP